jgi:hypothetical protein
MVKTYAVFARNLFIVLMIEAVHTSVTSINFQTTRRYIPESCHLQCVGWLLNATENFQNQSQVKFHFELYVDAGYSVLTIIT